MKRQQTALSPGPVGGFAAPGAVKRWTDPLSGAVRRGRAWAPVAKAAALFVLPAPLALASLAALIAGDLGELGGCISLIAEALGGSVNDQPHPVEVSLVPVDQSLRNLSHRHWPILS